jgi:hypothetical protein
MSRGVKLSSDSSAVQPVTGVKIKLHSDQGEEEDFTEEREGTYTTAGAIRGVIGGTYHITMEMPDGSTFESEPETIKPVGEVTNMTFQFEHRTIKKLNNEVNADVFSVYIDADAGPMADDRTLFVRWRFTGTYKVVTSPKDHMTYGYGPPYMTPLPCSGYEVAPALGGGYLNQIGECTCCTCYAHQYENKPVLSDVGLVEGGQFRNIKVTEIPVTGNTFYEKVMVEVEQMSLSRSAYNFYKTIRDQKDGASNIFQPPPGKVRGNINAVNANYNIVGLFSASSIRKKTGFIHREDVPYTPPPVTFITLSCKVYPHAVTDKPENWDE